MEQVLRQFVVKIHSRCNLACDYCYVYEMADQRWRSRPVRMPAEILEQTSFRIGEHVRAHGLPTVDVVLHGGEPLLAGVPAIRRFVDSVRVSTGGVARFSLQTNGLLLSEEVLEALADVDVRVGVSIDGAAADHDRHRVHRSGAGSHAAVARALETLAQSRFRSIYGGLLCTIDLAGDPVETYEALISFTPPVIDFLLPHGNWSAPPPGVGAYADWLIAVFDRWYQAPVPETSVRMFSEIVNVLLGGRSAVEGIGSSPTMMVVVETDGAIEGPDQLASAFHGAAVTGLHVSDASFDEAARLLVPDVLPLPCSDCEVRAVCGGGLPAHRYCAGSGFEHRTVYCADMFRLIQHVRQRLHADIAALTGKS
ncbi:FxsB family cyclophane-forming radical SAM/SPASM peptide maturase [Lentzea sp. NPDC058450]|uniref:FxsB family cyclophane-forming radical SAM/SPASM peptide maturase n=1 Tax=Lentzea sp. NPDC058450 TaxID=3346505 RepID=UPI0036478729